MTKYPAVALVVLLFAVVFCHSKNFASTLIISTECCVSGPL